MSAGVCFVSEHRGWMQDQWSWVFSNFGIADLWELNAPVRPGRAPRAVNQGKRGKDGSLYQPTIKIDTAAELPSERPLVVLSPISGKYIQGEQPLDAFLHPDNAIYLFGGSQGNLSDEEHLGGRAPDHLIYIPTLKLEMYAHSAAYITMWDRFVKRGGFG